MYGAENLVPVDSILLLSHLSCHHTVSDITNYLPRIYFAKLIGTEKTNLVVYKAFPFVINLQTFLIAQV